MADLITANHDSADAIAADKEAKEAVASWTEDRVELLRKLWLDGFSASMIAARLAGGVSRNAVIGKVHRLGLSKRARLPTPGTARLRGQKTDLQSLHPAQPQQRAMAMPMRGNVALVVQSMPFGIEAPRHGSDRNNVVALSESVTIMDLRESMCRWPVGDPASPEFRYCGGKAPVGEGPYCSIHSRMAYQPAQDRRARKIA